MICTILYRHLGPVFLPHKKQSLLFSRTKCGEFYYVSSLLASDEGPRASAGKALNKDMINENPMSF